MGGAQARNNQDPFETEGFAGLLGHPQVPEVDGVERSPEDSDPPPHARHALQDSRIWPSPKAMNFRVVSSSRPIGPKAWILEVEIPISAPRPS